ncbi:PRKR-interacting protein 1 like [Verticillium longisporum]|uniref:PRKR-interacting protein 1 like n=1 Tax=Verticillium longisporum TaxID=100787 RepID=A0A8I2ZJM5_VERLO|nr:PRKR-interacting protein 1 like [Verticillium longisporum]KAG7132890.1 PRKR-interacting protein 1 like [Verticillium longisporum]
MSGEGPESIPTSADPRSKRPTKRRALTPSSTQASSLDALFAKPDQEIRLPADVLLRRTSAAGAAPEIVTNVQGSSAGAGSGEFHVYKAARRREYERLRAMDDEVKIEKETEAFEREKLERDARDAERTRKNREKRDKKRKKGGDKKGAHPAAAANSGGGVARREIKDAEDQGTKDGETTSTETGQNGDVSSAAAAASTQPAGLVIHDDD